MHPNFSPLQDNIALYDKLERLQYDTYKESQLVKGCDWVVKEHI